ncbi:MULTISPECIES: hypothetical protein [unclassified Bradyrhizobium]|uniref:hypothetical protein n=1 Tax=unclassified Bradyrhizobium TaxID=2631580 RepID=UPI001CD4AA11|nr:MULTISPECIES: hypothetical protein [unclassified Bradyrhizobium]MCA1386052.1 hypothetical protein [Bradyrhizobium sp. BRP05]MCA1393850.1 hypothetical protein [Bradyrhizobium sp. IC3123]MCA1423494.1 hypothetical protein [Bradyrhizobium sp. BRP23]MCA1430612.1 hypothetical protein [Bradyrhizobium sp. NBAIM16]MCA1480123.1 hypothetical protein [Bradyrhizobium sp. NBAIM08]
MISDDPKKAIKFVAAFLPGFIGLGLASYLVDLRFGELAYAFISIAISIASFGIASLAMRQWRAKKRKPAQAVATAEIVLAYVVALVLGIFVSVAYDDDWVITAVNKIPFVSLTKTTQDHPLLYVLKKSFTCVAVRPIDARENNTLVYTKAMVRAIVKDYATVEGFIRVYPTELDPAQVFLSPACKVDGKKTTAIPGPGVLVQTENVIAWELIDATASECWKIHYGSKPPCLCPSEEVKDKYMARMNVEKHEQQDKYQLCTADK